MSDTVLQKPENFSIAHLSTEQLLRDYALCVLSREASVIARKEVLTGKAKFGITGDGKELPQVVLAHYCRPGDFRSGYYRDQTWMLATGLMTMEEYFAQLYADTHNDPYSGGRQMNCHFATPLIDKEGRWLPHTARFNSSADISSTGGQMARALGLAQASKVYRHLTDVLPDTTFSKQGRELSIVSIGDASTSEGVFWETVNAAAVMQVPLAIFVWDDGYGISVPTELQTAKGSISEVLAGFSDNGSNSGIDIYTCNGHDYAGLHEVISTGLAKIRRTHTPALFHIKEVTQPQGHSTSGSHERYKSPQRMQFEIDFDCIGKFRQWLIHNAHIEPETLDKIDQESKLEARASKKRAWDAYQARVMQAQNDLKPLLEQLATDFAHNTQAVNIQAHLGKLSNPTVSEIVAEVRAVVQTLPSSAPAVAQLRNWVEDQLQNHKNTYSKHLYAEHFGSALNVPVVPATYDDAPLKNGSEILNAFFDTHFTLKPELLAFGEDVGQIGDVNQGFAGLQAKHGAHRIFDTGIREWTIMGQAIGLAMRGLRPIAEIQYLDYLIYGLSPLSDDLATLRWRSNGQQTAPAIIRTRGHRLEGIWHAGSPLGMMVNSLRGMWLCVPRNMTQAAGMYNTLFQSMEPAVVIECLNGYRLKERLPNNLDRFTVPLGQPEILQHGQDVTLVTYGSCVRVAQKAVERLLQVGIHVELIDIQTLLPFDLHHTIVKSLTKTNRLVVLDEDVPGGASAYILQQVLEVQEGYRYLDSAPTTITAAPHRPPYGSEGDYFCKPSAEDVFDKIYTLLHEAEPTRFPL